MSTIEYHKELKKPSEAKLPPHACKERTQLRQRHTLALGLSVCMCLRLYDTCTCSSRRHPTPLQATPGAASNVMHVCNTHLTFPSNLCRSPPRQASTPRACARTHTHSLTSFQMGTPTRKRSTRNAHTDQTDQTYIAKRSVRYEYRHSDREARLHVGQRRVVDAANRVGARVSSARFRSMLIVLVVSRFPRSSVYL